MKKILLLLTVFTFSAVFVYAAPAKAKKTAPIKKASTSAPSFTLPHVRTGNDWSTADYTGTPLLIAVVSSGCTHCQKTLPQLEEARKSLRNVQFVAVFVDQTPAAPLKLLQKDGLRLDAVYGGQTVAERLNVDGVPMLFLYDAKHELVKIFNGSSDTRVKELKDAAKDLEKEVNMVSVESL